MTVKADGRFPLKGTSLPDRADVPVCRKTLTGHGGVFVLPPGRIAGICVLCVRQGILFFNGRNRFS
jgi:hypothetical protein